MTLLTSNDNTLRPLIYQEPISIIKIHHMKTFSYPIFLRIPIDKFMVMLLLNWQILVELEYAPQLIRDVRSF